ncbi:hypothetical protein [Paenibacillus wynnii]|nr:hypothetical protein [Paenibacillus wynnii]MDQ0196287.1 hypothetical protein [Paenibacillus wynnii]
MSYWKDYLTTVLVEITGNYTTRTHERREIKYTRTQPTFVQGR